MSLIEDPNFEKYLEDLSSLFSQPNSSGISVRLKIEADLNQIRLYKRRLEELNLRNREKKRQEKLELELKKKRAFLDGMGYSFHEGEMWH